MNSTKQTWFPHVQWLRAFAALSVLIYHIIELYPWKEFPITGAWIWFHAGWMGVDFFFVISGFVIMLAAQQAMQHPPAAARKQFMVRRVLRIYPLYMITIIAFLCVVPEFFDAPHVGAHLITHIFLIHNLHPTTHGSLNGPNWSVAAEMQFYIVVCILMPWLVRIKILWLLGFGILCAILCRTILNAVVWYWGKSDFTHILYSTQVPMMADMFAYGMAVALVVTRYPEMLQGKARIGIISSALMLATILLWCVLRIFWQESDFWGNPAMIIFWRSFLGLGFALVLVVAVWLPTKGTSSLLYKAGHYTGEISYGIYLWHLPVILLLKQYTWDSPLQFCIAVLVIVLGLSSLSWHLIEKLCIRYAKKKTA